ncbi:OmpA family protein [Neisseria montereyensis]|uniref:OmpA family protein n=1 Tax=Neisseria montereyensis TaxID=2973938 RepID=A0ABT2FEG7_9NEIS|nr:OmpA family protein [Neisseria montereyensis]MCS4534134.1 OmpA family protein [Neisseria montereyensis]
MSDNDNHKEQRIGLWIAGGAAGLAVLSILFYAVWGWENGKIEGSPGYDAAASEVMVVEEQEVIPEPAVVNEDASEVEALAVVPEETAASAALTDAVAEQLLASSEEEVDNGAVVVVENGVVKFYFASGKSDLAANAQDALQDVLAGVKEGKKAVISGFHDATGNQAQNESLSKDRAFAVRNALLGLGVPESQIELRKPENATGTGNRAEARRVEVILE